jgi:uncharacterized Zn-binding protein involved in type VI secretion
MPAAARVTDAHSCPASSPNPHVGGVIAPPGVIGVTIGYLPAATVTHNCVCPGPPNPITTGSGTVTIAYQPAARMGDSTAHGGFITSGDTSVDIG